MSFHNLGLSESVVHGVQSMGFVDPTAIQLRSFPHILEGKDMIASAQTGTGKTAAFALPILSKMKKHGKLRCLVLEPTRELAAQVETSFRDYGRFTNLRVCVLHGGVGYGKQTDALKHGVDTVVATPGRLLDHLEQGNLKLDHIEYLVLDEMDRMLDMGFLPDVKKIAQHCSTQRQTLLFSATMPPELERLSSWVLKNPEIIEIGVRRSPAETVTHAMYPVSTSQKYELLLALLESVEYNSVLIFTRTKIDADRIAHRLKADQHAVCVLHSSRTQTERFDALEGFKSGRYEVMVATDLAARGLDVSGISHVVNYDVPLHAEDYVHRIGRTGRAMTTGDAFTIMTAEDVLYVQAIERFIGASIPRSKLAGFNYTYTTLLEDEEKASNTMRRGASPKGRRRRR